MKLYQAELNQFKKVVLIKLAFENGECAHIDRKKRNQEKMIGFVVLSLSWNLRFNFSHETL